MPRALSRGDSQDHQASVQQEAPSHSSIGVVKHHCARGRCYQPAPGVTLSSHVICQLAHMQSPWRLLMTCNGCNWAWLQTHCKALHFCQAAAGWSKGQQLVSAHLTASQHSDMPASSDIELDDPGVWLEELANAVLAGMRCTGRAAPDYMHAGPCRTCQAQDFH